MKASSHQYFYYYRHIFFMVITYLIVSATLQAAENSSIQDAAFLRELNKLRGLEVESSIACSSESIYRESDIETTPIHGSYYYYDHDQTDLQDSVHEESDKISYLNWAPLYHAYDVMKEGTGNIIEGIGNISTYISNLSSSKEWKKYHEIEAQNNLQTTGYDLNNLPTTEPDLLGSGFGLLGEKSQDDSKNEKVTSEINLVENNEDPKNENSSEEIDGEKAQMTFQIDWEDLSHYDS